MKNNNYLFPKVLLVICIILTVSCNVFTDANIVYVSTKGVDNTLMNGGSPDYPLRTIGAASTVVANGGSIYVAGGLYEACHVYSRDISFNVYGGYDDAFSARDSAAYKTILDAAEEENGYAVVAANNNTLIDGCTLQNSKMTGVLIGADVGIVTVTLNNCIIQGNEAQGSNAGWCGGAITVKAGSILIMTDCVVKNNYGSTGGIQITENSAADISGCTIQDNTGDYTGGISCAVDSTLTMINCTVSNNTPDGISGSYTDNGGNTID